MNVGSMCTGIGGIDLGLEHAGMTVAWQAETDPYANRVLARHWPHVPNLGDIHAVDWSTVEPVDLVCGGYPCQPFSLAGARRGADDPRYLWPEFARALRVLRPRWALLENVPGHLSLGFGRVLGDLAELGFDAAWDCIPAAAVGAPHLRYRLFVVVHADAVAVRHQPLAVLRRVGAALAGADGAASAVAHPDRERLPQRGEPDRQPAQHPEADHTPRRAHAGRRGTAVADPDREGRSDLQGRPPSSEQPRLGAADSAGWWDAEPDVGRVAHGVPHRVDRLRCLGSAVVPQVAELIGRAILDEDAAP